MTTRGRLIWLMMLMDRIWSCSMEWGSCEALKATLMLGKYRGKTK